MERVRQLTASAAAGTGSSSLWESHAAQRHLGGRTRRAASSSLIRYTTCINPTPPPPAGSSLHIEPGSAASTIPLAKWIGLIIKYYFRANQISRDLSLLGVRGAAVAYKHLSIYKVRALGFTLARRYSGCGG